MSSARRRKDSKNMAMVAIADDTQGSPNVRKIATHKKGKSPGSYVNVEKVSDSKFKDVLGPLGHKLAKASKKKSVGAVTPAAGKDAMSRTKNRIAPGTTMATKSYSPKKKGKQASKK